MIENLTNDEPYRPTNYLSNSEPPSSEGSVDWLLICGFLLGALPAFVCGIYLLANTLELDPAKRSIPSCGTAAVAGLACILIGCPILGAAGLALTAFVSYIFERMREQINVGAESGNGRVSDCERQKTDLKLPALLDSENTDIPNRETGAK